MKHQGKWGKQLYTGKSIKKKSRKLPFGQLFHALKLHTHTCYTPLGRCFSLHI